MIFIIILQLITLYLSPRTIHVNADTFECEITVHFISVHLDMHFDIYLVHNTLPRPPPSCCLPHKYFDLEGYQSSPPVA